MLEGIMISEEDRSTNIKMLENEKDKFILIRAGYTSYGNNKKKYKDSKFNEYYRIIKDNNHKVYIYYESCATNEIEAIDEANYFLNIIKDKNIESPLFVLINDDHNTIIYSKISQKGLSKDKLNNVINEFCKVIINSGYYIFVLSEKIKFENKSNILNTNYKMINYRINENSEYRYINIIDDPNENIEIVLSNECFFKKIKKGIMNVIKNVKNKIGKIFKK